MSKSFYFAVIILGLSDILTVERRPAPSREASRQKYIRRLILCWTDQIDSDILPIRLPSILQVGGGKKCEISPQFSTPRFEARWFWNEDLKSKKAVQASMIGLYDHSSVHSALRTRQYRRYEIDFQPRTHFAEIWYFSGTVWASWLKHVTTGGLGGLRRQCGANYHLLSLLGRQTI